MMATWLCLRGDSLTETKWKRKKLFSLLRVTRKVNEVVNATILMESIGLVYPVAAELYVAGMRWL